jgi:hypothetical protein
MYIGIPPPVGPTSSIDMTTSSLQRNGNNTSTSTNGAATDTSTTSLAASEGGHNGNASYESDTMTSIRDAPPLPYSLDTKRHQRAFRRSLDLPICSYGAPH